MSDKLTNCPTVLLHIKYTVPQLTVAQGMVCCPKCSTSFNALSHLVVDKALSLSTPSAKRSQNSSKTKTIDVNQYNIDHSAIKEPEAPTHALLKLFDQKVENSNIDLKTYLNNLELFQY